MEPEKIACVDPERSVEDLERLRARLAENEGLLRSRSDHYTLLGGLTRLKILALLDCSGELCVCDLATILEMTPAAVSQHLGRLRSAGLVAPRRDKMTIYYRRTDQELIPPLCFPALGSG
ncbi:MAG: metalloregulator ArsR/SmtB family transcription factor [Acidobacteriota bacterium]